MSGSLAGKAVILTGGSGGQGQVAARLLVEEGASVVLTDRDPSGAQVAEALGPNAVFVPHDITSRDDWALVVGTCADRFGKVDGLINNAAIAGRDGIETLTPEALHRYFDVNVIGALNGIQAVIPAMRRAGQGAIVNIASISALKATPGIVGYGISKWAIRGLTRNAAVELAPDRIRVNVVLPGSVEVQMIKDGEASADKGLVARQIPIGRLARAEEIVRATIFLLSDHASYVSGEEFVVDGGWCA